MKTQKFNLDQVCALVDLPKRTVRYYIQLGLVDRPEGANRGSFYTQRHIEQLLAVKKWRDSGLTLERIGEVVSGAENAQALPRPRKAGDMEVWSHVTLADGVELHLEPGRAGLTSEQVRRLASEVLAIYETVKGKEE